MLTACQQNVYTHFAGYAEGTSYSIIYNGAVNYQNEIAHLLHDFEHSLSVYDTVSIISKVNRNEDVVLDSFFIHCFQLSQHIYAQTNGAFDISASPLFNAWGFGSDKQHRVPPQTLIDSVKAFCGMDKVWIENGRVRKTDQRLQLNCNAVAKGYSVDVVALFLDSKSIKNYLVEIGGEVFCKGVNAQQKQWSIGIDKPEDGNYTPGEQLQTVVVMSNRALATSGNYRRFFEQGGVKYGHTIDPRTGHPAKHHLLSASVLAASCGAADAYATALMVMGLDSAKLFLAQHPELEGYLIFEENNELKTYATKGFGKS
ncbi:FAD:protein FMN transferase [Bacteroidia bacterium]|nr:FAD:protein FMN transferase [Bacteroidia bacterium]